MSGLVYSPRPPFRPTNLGLQRFLFRRIVGQASDVHHTYVSLIQTLPEATIKRLVGHSKNMDTFGVYAHELTDTGSRVSSDLTNIFTTLIG